MREDLVPNAAARPIGASRQMREDLVPKAGTSRQMREDLAARKEEHLLWFILFETLAQSRRKRAPRAKCEKTLCRTRQLIQ